jgi:hypothetical protein
VYPENQDIRLLRAPGDRRIAGDVLEVDGLAVNLAGDGQEPDEARHPAHQAFFADLLLEVGIKVSRKDVRSPFGFALDEGKKVPTQSKVQVERDAQLARREALLLRGKKQAGQNAAISDLRSAASTVFRKSMVTNREFRRATLWPASRLR